MKKFVSLVIMFSLALGFASVPSASVKAQTPLKSYSKTIAAGAADTTTYLNMASGLKSLQYTVTKDTGTVAGKVYLQVRDNAKWKSIDSLTLANNTSDQSLFHIPVAGQGTSYLHYRFLLAPTGNWKSEVSVGGIRRTDEMVH